mmetsp:Transcript_12120/g.16512  ORF Transcript_12120/g.16512 Transcript_12120/m.16512 type:complete len:351 (-) Transcript_12120:304-1356(-)|eukprot:CAMPEP_0196591400 /NCGR_PEP_ID=MMETSP1081-20130531/69455_1 /TAXON_ID=36882 /ORGANISM="Pyramimonas amylifera, Strain CCMP720" /LENGTH=350 /DNA_ID=CAMNT_0041914753 /DNA_START=73 /DNA_END=1125 /DNA_ORIENTATION=+
MTADEENPNTPLLANNATTSPSTSGDHLSPDSSRVSLSNGPMDPAKLERARAQVNFAVKISVVINCGLFFIKATALYLSHSYAIFSSLVDSTIDLMNQVVLYWAEHQMAKPSRSYPAGKTRLEPVAIIISAVLMCALSLQVVQYASTGLFSGLTGEGKPFLEISRLTEGILLSCIVTKLGLFLYCNRLRKISGTAMALAEDHRNDVFSNTMAISTAIVADKFPIVWWLDPIGALIISLYIICSWIMILKEQVQFVVGRTADADTIERVRSIADCHHDNVILDQIRVYHIGRHFLVELEIVMPRESTLEEVHDVSLDLQNKLELESDIERAFVHVDYETRPHLEHKEPRLL